MVLQRWCNSRWSSPMPGWWLVQLVPSRYTCQGSMAKQGVPFSKPGGSNLFQPQAQIKNHLHFALRLVRTKLRWISTWQLLAAKVIGLGFGRPSIWPLDTGQIVFVTFAPQKFPVIKRITNFLIFSPNMSLYFLSGWTYLMRLEKINMWILAIPRRTGGMWLLRGNFVPGREGSLTLSNRTRFPHCVPFQGLKLQNAYGLTWCIASILELVVILQPVVWWPHVACQSLENVRWKNVLMKPMIDLTHGAAWTTRRPQSNRLRKRDSKWSRFLTILSMILFGWCSKPHIIHNPFHLHGLLPASLRSYDFPQGTGRAHDTALVCKWLATELNDLDDQDVAIWRDFFHPIFWPNRDCTCLIWGSKL